MFDFEKWPVYVTSTETYCKLHQNVFNHKKLNRNLKDQLERASSSITLNIAEGAGKFSKREKKNYYTIARGSIYECIAILKLLKIQNIMNNDLYEEVYGNFDLIGKMLTGLIKTMGEKLSV